MRIIILKGASDVGKSTTLNAVHNELCSFNGVSSTPKRILGNPINNDFECIVTLKDQRKVAFFTMGDIVNPLKDGIERYSYLECELLIIALNEKHSKKILDDFIALSYPFNVVEKSEPFRDITSQWADCGAILSLI